MQTTKIWNGRWSDGKTAAAKEVGIELSETALRFRPADAPGAEPTEWPYDLIRSPHPVHIDDRTVLLSFHTKPGERLFIEDKDFAKRILDQAPEITHGAHQWSLLKWPLGIAASIVLFWALTYFNIISPANTLAFMLPEQARISLGKGVINTIRNNKKICSTPQGDRALEKLLIRLNPAITNHKNYSVKIVDLNFVNAFAAPGNQIMVSGKLIREAANADEVAGVISHEIGHAIERHPEANIIRAFGILTVIQVLTAGESGTVGDLAFFLVQSGYSRTAEQEADDHAERILNKVTIDTRPLAGFFERLMNKRSLKTVASKDGQKDNDKAGLNEGVTEDKAKIPSEQKQPTATPKEKTDDRSILRWISSHPATKSRIKQFRKSKITTSPPILSETEWQSLKLICGKKVKKKQTPEEKDKNPVDDPNSNKDNAEDKT